MLQQNKLKTFTLFTFLLFYLSVCARQESEGMISGRIISTDKQAVSYATVQLKGTGYGSATNDKGIYHVKAPAGKYTLTVYSSTTSAWSNCLRNEVLSVPSS